jgi:uncharacterized protein (TIRG00374 family)
MKLTFWQINLLLGVNAFVVLCLALRWWLIARAEQPHLPFLPFIGYRLAAFSLNYFTPGPQIGGEPLQVFAIHRHGVSLPRAVSIMLVDKLLELLGNFVFIAAAMVAFLRLGGFSGGQLPVITTAPILLLVLAWPLIHVLLLHHAILPITALMKAALPGFRNRIWFRLLVISEKLAASFLRRHPMTFLGALMTTLLICIGMAVEYLLMLRYLDVQVSLDAALLGLTASTLAFLLPVPGGLGALEGSQILVLGFLGYPAPLAISLALLMRLRDVLNGSFGLLCAARFLSPIPSRPLQEIRNRIATAKSSRI